MPATAITFISRGCVVSISFSEIILVRKYHDKTIIKTERDEYVGTGALVHLEQALPENDFFRVHKSILLSVRYLHLLHTEIAVTPHYKKLLKLKFKHILEQRLRTMTYCR